MSVYMFGAVQCSHVLFLLFCVSNPFISAMVTELPSVWKKTANSVYHLLFCLFAKMCCPSFPLVFRVGFGFGQFLKYLYYFNLLNY